jgi:hypothetical protein
MKVHAYFGFFAVGGMLVFLGLVLLLAVPAAGLVVVVLGGVHLLIGSVLRGRAGQTSP